MKKPYVYAFAVVLFIALSACTSVDNQAREYFNKGNAALDAGDYDAAIKNFTESIKLTPSVGAHNNRGEAYTLTANYEKAIADYSQAIKIKPNDARFYFNRGLAHEKNMDHKRAIDDYSEAIRINPNDARFYFNRALSSLLAYGESSKVFSDINEAIRINPNDAEFYKFRGNLYYLTEDDSGHYDYESGNRDFAEAIRLDPNLKNQIDSIKSTQKSTNDHYNKTHQGSR